MNFKQDLKKVMILYPEIPVESSEDYRDLINIHNIVEASFGEKLDRGLVRSAFNSKKEFKLESANDYYFLVFKTASDFQPMKKVAYPMNLGQEIDEEFDLQKWSKLVYKIYDAVSGGDMPFGVALDYYAKTLDAEANEEHKFKQWVKFYQDGEHLRYSEEDNDLKKEAFQFPISGPGFYGPDNATAPDSSFSKVKKEVADKTNYQEWRGKLYSAIRRIDKLLRLSDDYVDIDSQRELADLLHHFDQEVRSLKHETTASDLSFKYANKFKKLGFNAGFDELSKYSQELDASPAPDALSPELESEEDISGPAPGPQGDLLRNKTPTQEERSSAIQRSLSGGSGAKIGEYEALAGNVELSDAVSKLEEIAGRLADRRTIRMLAEFDIMLDKIGIAPMFPELAEAQSKLIDGYSYALTRVTKMLGMLSSGKSLVEISDARKTTMNDKAMKEVNKEFEPPEQPQERGATGIQEEMNAPDEIPAKPAPTPEPQAAPEV